MDPPVRNGGIAASSSPRPHSTPTPDGPSILWPENAAKSTPSAVRFTGWCGTDWQASSTVSAPTARARDTSSATGRIVPSTLDWCANATTFVRSRQLERVEVEPAVVGHAVPAQDRAGAPAQLLPRHEVGVVLQLGDDDLVAGLEREPRRLRAQRGADRRVRERVGDEVDPLGGVLGEHHLVRVRPDERRDPRARRLVRVGGLLGELVRAAVHCRVVLLQERPLGVQTCRGRCAVAPESR